MKRMLITTALALVLSGTVLAGDMPGVDAPAPGSTQGPSITAPGNTQGPTITATVILTLISLVHT